MQRGTKKCELGEGTKESTEGPFGYQAPRGGGGPAQKLLQSLGAWQQPRAQKQPHTHYFLPLHPPILVPSLHLQLAQAQGLREIYSGKRGVHPQQGKQPLPLPTAS